MLQGALSILVSIHRLFLFNTNLQGWVVSFWDTCIGPIHGHLIHCSFGILFECYFLSEARSRAHTFPSVLTVLFWHPLCFLAWLFCHIIAHKTCAWHPSFSAPIVSVLEWLCYLRIHSPNRPCIFCRFLPIPTPCRILWMNETSEALLILLILMLGWFRELPDSGISSLYQSQSLSITSEHPTFPHKQFPGPEYLYLQLWWVASDFLS